jgi:hypothetical protein
MIEYPVWPQVGQIVKLKIAIIYPQPWLTDIPQGTLVRVVNLEPRWRKPKWGEIGQQFDEWLFKVRRLNDLDWKNATVSTAQIEAPHPLQILGAQAV